MTHSLDVFGDARDHAGFQRLLASSILVNDSHCQEIPIRIGSARHDVAHQATTVFEDDAVDLAEIIGKRPIKRLRNVRCFISTTSATLYDATFLTIK